MAGDSPKLGFSVRKLLRKSRDRITSKVRTALDEAKVDGEDLTTLNESGICSRCAGIDWEYLARRAQIEDKLWGWGSIEILMDTLISTCRVCHLLLGVVQEAKSRIPGKGTELIAIEVNVFKPLLGDARTLHNITLRTGSDGSIVFYNCALGLAIKDDEGLAVDCSMLRLISSEKINMNLLRKWISVCKEQHGEECQIATSESIPYLQVLNVNSGLVEEF